MQELEELFYLFAETLQGRDSVEQVLKCEDLERVRV